MQHAFTVDVEAWYHPVLFYRRVAGNEPTRLETGMLPLMELLAEHGVRATFFWVGELASRYKPLLRQLVAQGHEIGCHSWGHDRFVYDMSPDEFRQDTARALAALEDASGTKVTSYRAPCFSITRRSLWAFAVLAELGVTIDSSVFPLRSWRYGVPGFRVGPHEVSGAPGLWEAPLPVSRRLGLRLPATGGAYFRLYPFAFSQANVRALDRQGLPVVFYLHPWELDPGHPQVHFHPLAARTHYFNLSATRSRLQRLLREFEFTRIDAVIATLNGASPPSRAANNAAA